MCVVLVFTYFLIINSNFTWAFNNRERIIQTFSGPVRGVLLRYEEVLYYSYEGIPYAEKPSGSLRFRPPIARRPWTKVFNATQEPPVCPQLELKYTRAQMSEDCLRLNIFVPANLKEPLPVLVFIHGGAFHLISGNTDLIYGPQLLLRQGIIFITINYRIGALGFMSLDIEEASGNAGLKDVLLALRWIKRNIKHFGGDSENISLGGNSSGASIVNFLLMTKHSTGLFHKAILLSGSALSYRALSRHPVENTLTLARQICPANEDTNKILKCLREANVFDIATARIEMKKEDGLLKPFTPFLPSIEKDFPHAIITKDPREILETHGLQNMPIFAGFNSKEGVYMTSLSFRHPDYVLSMLKKNIELIIPTDIEYPLRSKKSLALSKSIVKFYFGDKFFSNWSLSNAYDFISDTHYIFSTDTWINIHKQRNDCNSIYYYIFNFDGDLNWCKIFYNITFPGASHADDLGYLFLTHSTEPKLKKADARSLRTVIIMTTLLSNFVKFGNPTPTNSLGLSWPEYNTHLKMLLLNDEPSNIKMFEPIRRRLQFWKEVYNEYYKYVNDGGKLEYKIVP